jgi:hypothetical protein
MELMKDLIRQLQSDLEMFSFSNIQYEFKEIIKIYKFMEENIWDGSEDVLTDVAAVTGAGVAAVTGAGGAVDAAAMTGVKIKKVPYFE